MTQALSGSFLEGSIRHRRVDPVGHEFCYPIGMYGVRLSEWDQLPSLARGVSTRHINRIWFRRRDYFQPGNGDLETAVRRHVYLATDWEPDGPIELITHPRYFGWCFNPVSFYLCYAADAHASDNPVPRVILAQITNTPWHERHSYCLSDATVTESRDEWRTMRFRFPKQFHVSPFNPMEQDYEWLFAFHPQGLRVHMNVKGSKGKAFDATLSLRRYPLDAERMQYAMKRYPAETIKASIGIHWHAFKLWRKGARFHDHPGYAGGSSEPLGSSCLTTTDTMSNLNNVGTVTSWKT